MKRGTLFIALAILLAGSAHAETFREVLNNYGIPLKAFSEPELEANVASGRAAEIGTTIALVYPTAGENAKLGPPFHVVLFDRTSKKLARRLIFSTARDSDPQAEVSGICFGAVMGLSEQGGDVLFTTRINPSAGCTVVLNSELWVSQVVMGWPLAQLDDSRVLMEENMVHSHAIHSARLEMLDLMTGGLTEVYPPVEDALRLKFSADLEKNGSADSSCATCDPKYFEEEVPGPVFVNDTGSRFGFISVFDPKHFGAKAEHDIGKRFVMYVYQRQPDGWGFCQQEVADLELKAVMGQIQNDLDGVAHRCTDVHPVKVAEVKSAFAKYEKRKQ